MNRHITEVNADVLGICGIYCTSERERSSLALLQAHHLIILMKIRTSNQKLTIARFCRIRPIGRFSPWGPRITLSSRHLSYHMSQSSALASSVIRSNSSLSHCYFTHVVTFTSRCQSGSSERCFLFWVNDAAGWATDPARHRWHVGAACCRRTGELPFIKCIYLRGEGRRGSSTGTEVQSDAAWLWFITAAAWEQKKKMRGEEKQRKPPDLFLHTLPHQTRPAAWRPIHKHLRQSCDSDP